MTTHRSALRVTTAIVFAMILVAIIGAPSTARAHTVTTTHCNLVASLWPPGTTIRRVIAGTCAERAQAHARVHTCARTDLTVYAAIDCTWPAPLRTAAKVIAQCESTANVSNATARARGLGRWARNGQYWGPFQMGTDERAAHGEYRIGDDARVQVRSALSLYDDRGWQPWTFSGSSGSRCHGYS